MAHAGEIYQDNLRKRDLSTRVRPKKAQTNINQLTVVSGEVSNEHRYLVKTSLDDMNDAQRSWTARVFHSGPRGQCQDENANLYKHHGWAWESVRFSKQFHFVLNMNDVWTSLWSSEPAMVSKRMNDVSTRYLLWKESQQSFLNQSVEACQGRVDQIATDTTPFSVQTSICTHTRLPLVQQVMTFSNTTSPYETDKII